jgi:DNA polymerase-1
MIEKSKSYQHFFGLAPKDQKFLTDFKYELVSVESYGRVMAELDQHEILAIDTETTGLSFIDNHIVSVVVSPSAYQSYVFPIRHISGAEQNLSESVLVDLWNFFKRKKLLLYNAIFDLLMLEYDREINRQIENPNARVFSFLEVMSLTFNSDTEYKPRNLKEMSRVLLGRDCPEFWDVVGKKITFDYLTPEEGLYYAACDGANTYGLFLRLHQQMEKECPLIIKIDNELTKCFLFLAKQEINIDKERMQQVVKELKTRNKEVENLIFREVGYPFECGSNRQVSQALASLGIYSGVTTKMGAMSVSAKLLEKLDHPICKLIIERNSIATQVNSYSEKLSKVDKGRIQYKLFHVPTGRLASGGERSTANKANSYYLTLNYQNLTKPHPAMFRVISVDDNENILGYKFIEADKQFMEENPSEKYVEGATSKLNVRSAITVPNRDEWYFLSVDYAAEELLVVGALAREQNILGPLLSGSDLHKETAIKMFGEENYDKEKRRMAKGATFGLNYGGSSRTLQKVAGMSEEDANESYRKYWEVMTKLRAWTRTEISKAYRNNGVVRSGYGRPRRLKHFLTSPEGKWRQFGERSVASHLVQGICGDFIRIVIINLTKLLLIPYPEKVRWIGCIHDEINLAVKKEYFTETVKEVRKIMALKIPGTEISLSTTVEVGYSYGETFPFEMSDEGVWIPKFA